MGLFIFNIIHMYLGGASGYGLYTTLFRFLTADNMARYAELLTITNLDMMHTQVGSLIETMVAPHCMLMAIKQVYGYAIWVAGAVMLVFLSMDIPSVRTQVRKVPYWPKYAIEYLATKMHR